MAYKMFFVINFLLLICITTGQESRKPLIKKAVAVVRGVLGSTNVTGRITFSRKCTSSDKKGKLIRGNVLVLTGFIDGLAPGKHGFHVHQFGNLTDNCDSAGPHFSLLTTLQHGAPEDRIRHTGDLGNIVADRFGRATIHIVDSVISLNGPASIIGRAVVVHEGVDDLGRVNNTGSRTTGNAGRRLACGIIGIAEERNNS